MQMEVKFTSSNFVSLGWQWAFQGLVINEFQGTTLTCDEQDRKCLLVGGHLKSLYQLHG